MASSSRPPATTTTPPTTTHHHPIINAARAGPLAIDCKAVIILIKYMNSPYFRGSMEMTSTFINSLLPQTSNGQQENTVCTPGDKLFSVSDGFHAGSGCYEFHGTIRASLTGYVHVYELKNSVCVILYFNIIPVILIKLTKSSRCSKE